MNSFEENLQKSLQIYYKEEIKKISKDIKKYPSKNLSLEEKKILVEKILLLPIENQTLLLSKYIYKESPEEVERIFYIKDPKESLDYTIYLLSKILGLENYIISDESLESACRQLVKVQTKEIESMKNVEKPKYSKAFKENMKKLGIKTETTFVNILKKVAVFFLIVSTSLTLFFSINVEAREKFFDWIIEDHGDFSIFTPENIENRDMEQLKIDDLKINYIPEGYELVDIQKGKINKIYTYKNKSDNYFRITLSELIESYGTNAYDTEDAILEEIKINGHDGYIWRHNEYMLIWQQNGIECFIYGNISREEIIKIAEYISK